MPPSSDFDLEIRLDRLQPGSYRVELRFNDPNSDALGQSATGVVAFDLDALEARQANNARYGEALSAGLFQDEALRQYFDKCKVRVGENNLRLRLFIDSNAAELHGLRWELLRDPLNQRMLATNERILFSRFIVTRDWRPVKLNAKSKLRALVAVASPTNLSDFGMADIEKDREISAARRALTGIETQVLGATEPVTLKSLIAAIRKGVDIVYLICHGAYPESGEPKLFLQKENGELKSANGADFAQEIGDIAVPPRLMVLASCESAGDGVRSAESALAPRLAEAGIPAIVAMQAKVSMNTASIAMPLFFSELVKDGQIDRAMAVARAAVRDESDAWVPALYSRLKAGRIWYQPGFGGEGNDKLPWDSVCTALVSQKTVALVGPDLAERIFGTSVEFAAELARDHDIPLPPNERPDSAAIAQTINTNSLSATLREDWTTLTNRKLLATAQRLNPAANPVELAFASAPELMQLIVDKLYEDPTDPYRILVNLDIKIFVSGAMDSFLKLFLKKAGKLPIEMVSDWRNECTVDRSRASLVADELYNAIDQSPSEPAFDVYDRWCESLFQKYKTEDKKLPVSLQSIADAISERFNDFPDLPPLELVKEWRNIIRTPPDDTPLKPWPIKTPVLYYVYGKNKYQNTWVLTEDDFFDYLIRHSEFQFMPKIVAESLVASSLLFLGFSMDDWKFRILFRMIMSKEGKKLLENKEYFHIGVQVDPEEYTAADGPRIRALLAKYFGDTAKINIYWGNSADFLRELWDRLQDPKYKKQPVKAAVKRQSW